MTIQLTLQELETLEAKEVQAKAGQIGFWEIYQWLGDLLVTKGVGPTDSSLLWLRGAAEANSGRGAFSELIRSYTTTQYQLRYGESLSAGKMQEASNAVAQNLIDDLLGRNAPVWPKGQVPDIDRIGLADATAVGQVLFNRDPSDTAAELQQNSAWSGSLLFSLLNSNQTNRLVSTGVSGSIDTLNDVRDVLYAAVAYQAGLKAAALTWHFQGSTQRDTDIAIIGNTIVAYLTAPTNESLLTTLRLGATGEVGKMFKTVADIGAPVFLDMVMGAVQAKALTGTTTSANFEATARAFFGALNPTQLQAVNAKLWSDPAALSAAAQADTAEGASARAALAALSVVSVKISDTVANNFKLYDAATGEGEITREWITDRAAFTIAHYDTAKGLGGIVQSAENIRYLDAASNTEVLAGAGSAQRIQKLFGDDKANTLEGQGYADRLYGGAGNDSLNGKGGNDYLEGNSGSDTLNGGAGMDLLQGGKDSDTYTVDARDGADPDTLVDSDGLGLINVIDAGGTTFTLNGGNKSGAIWESTDAGKLFRYSLVSQPDGTQTLVIAGAGINVQVKHWSTDKNLGIELQDAAPVPLPDTSTLIEGDAQDNILEGTSADDLIFGYAGDDRITATQNGDDWIHGGAGRDFIEAGSGADLIESEAGRDVVFGQAGDDVIWGGIRSSFEEINDQNVAAWDDEADFLVGSIGDDSVMGGAGNDALWGGSGRDVLTGGAGDDNLFGDGAPVLVTPEWNLTRNVVTDAGGAVTSRTLVLTHAAHENGLDPQADLLFAGAGDDWVFAGAGDDYVDAATGSDVVYGGAGADLVNGGAGTDVLYGDGTDTDPQSLDFTPAAEHADDALYGQAGDDQLRGQGGDDYLSGGADNDELHGDAGDDILEGEIGNDTLRGDSSQSQASEHGKDLLDGGEGDDQLAGDGNDDELFGGAGNDYLIGDHSTLDSSLHGNDYLDGGTGNDTLFGQHGIDTLSGGDGNDQISGDAGADCLSGGGDDDLVFGGADNDTLNGDAGDDQLKGDGGSDSLDGGEGNDTLFGDDGNDTLQGGSGFNQLVGGDGDDLLVGGDGNDTLWGEAGNNTLSGGGGADVFHISTPADKTSITDATAGSLVVFDSGVNQDAVLGGSISSNTQSVALAGGGSVEIAGAVGFFQFSDGSVLTASQMGTLVQQANLRNQAPAVPVAPPDAVTGTTASDTLTGSTGSDYVFGGAGDDIVDGGDGNDAIFSEAGNDTVHGGNGADALVAGVGNDAVHGDAGADRLWGEAGDDLLYGGTGDDEITGGAGSDLLVGGGGDDLLTAGGTGAKTYQFELGDGADLVAAFTETRHIVFGSGIETTDIRMFVSPVEASQPYVNVQYSAYDSVLIRLGTTGLVDYRFADGTTLTQAALAQMATQPEPAPCVEFGTSGDDSLFAGLQATLLVGAAGHDALFGGQSDDELKGSSGNDTLYGNDGNDILEGGFDADTLQGGAGSDTYIYRRAAGSDTIIEEASASDLNTLRLIDLGSADVAYAREASGSLLIHIRGSIDTLEIKGWYSDTPTRIQQITYADGSVLDTTLLDALAQARIEGTSAADTLTGTAFADIISAGAGNDTIDGKEGDDQIAGGGGSDTYLLRRGMGIDSIEEVAGGSNVLKLGTGLTFDQLVTQRQGDDLYLHFTQAPDGVVLKDYFNGVNNWTVMNGSGDQQTLGQLIADEENRLAPDTIEELRLDWIASAKTALLQAYVNENSGYYSYEYTSEYVLAVDYPGYARVSYGFAVAAQGSDDGLILRQSDESSTTEGSGFTTSTHTLLVPVSTVKVIGSIAGSIAFQDYSQLDSAGQPTSYFWTADGGLSPDPGALGSSGYSYQSQTDYQTITYTVTLPNGDTNEILEHITAGPADNFINTWGMGTVDGGAGHDVILVDNGYGSEYPGQFIYGGEGDDLLMGGYSNDVLAGGDGDDYMAGGQGHERYEILIGDSGIKVIDEVSAALLIPGPDSTWLRVNPGDRYSTDTLRFGPGIELASLGIQQGSYVSPYAAHYADDWVYDTQTFSTLDISWGAGSRVQVLLAQGGSNPSADYPDNDGPGIEFFEFADGTVLAIQGMLALIGQSPDDGPSAPVLAQQVGDQSALEDQPWVFSFAAATFTDADVGDTLTYSVRQSSGAALPGWLSFNAQTRTFAGTALNEDVGTLNLVITATDGAGASANATFNLTVTNTNDAPVAAGSLPAWTAQAGAAAAYTVPTSAFSEMDVGDSLAFSATLEDGSALPGWLGFDPGLRQLSGTPANTDGGDLVVKITAVDQGGLQASQTIALRVNVNLSLVGTRGNDVLVGGPGDDTLDGMDSGDTLSGGAGNDVYYVNNGNDDVIEYINEGFDTVYTTAGTYNVDKHVELIIVAGTERGAIDAGGGAQRLVGNAAYNDLRGGGGNDTLDGDAGKDLLDGGTGDDTFYVDNFEDEVVEGAGDGTDVVYSTSASWTMGANIERLVLAGAGANAATGNASANLMTGNESNNTLKGADGNDTLIGGGGADSLDGGTGADSMTGGSGDDIYVVGDAGDVVVELAGEGLDTVRSSIDYTLGATVENLTLTATAIQGTGNALNNYLTGNAHANTLTASAGNDTLDGGAGSDTLVGGAGDDAYFTDVSTDVMTEGSNAGIDTVFSWVTRTLSSNLENLTLLGTSAINATGNAAANLLRGNSGSNVLTGANGADTLDGGAAADTLDGGALGDLFVLARGYGEDRVIETAASTGMDIVSFGSDVAINQLWFQKDGIDLLVSIIGTTDAVRISSWYTTGGAPQLLIEEFRTSDGDVLLEGNVQALVDAMASYAQPPLGQTTFSPS
ncbi:MAG: putative Ig domain-containing protein [Pseudomonadota bacterium]